MRIYLKAKFKSNAKEDMDSMLVKIPSIEKILSLLEGALKDEISVVKDNVFLKILLPNSFVKKSLIRLVPFISKSQISKEEFIKIADRIALKKNLPGDSTSFPVKCDAISLTQ